jgi:hypothetical protein
MYRGADLPVLYLYLFVTFAFGAWTAYADLESFFTQRGLASLVYKHLPSWGFVLANGLIAAGLLYWSLATDGNSAINKIIQVDSKWARMIVIGLAVPSLLRSKLFGGNDGTKARGLGSVYDWVRDKVLHSLNSYSSKAKDRIAANYSVKLATHANVPDLLRRWVLDEIGPFKSTKEIAEVMKEYDQYMDRSKTDPGYRPTDLLRDLIRWAMDNAGVGPIERRLEQEG